MTDPTTVTVVQLGMLDAAEADNILGVANQCQTAFECGDILNLGLDLSPYLLPNGGVDLDSAVEQMILPLGLARPVVVVSGEPYGIPDRGHEEGWFYFMGTVEPDVTIISTHLWEQLPGNRRLQPYLLFALGTSLISAYADLQFHDEMRGCVFDYCDQPDQIDQALDGHKFFCSRCRHYLEGSLARGDITNAQLAGAMRLIMRARGIDLSCFISYSHKDEAFAKRLYDRMKRDGLQVWLATKDLGSGRIHEEIGRSILLHDKMLLVLSDHSMNSQWVRSEVRWAKEAEADERLHKLLPVRLVDMDAVRRWRLFDADMGTDLAKSIRGFHVHDFSTWRDPAAFEETYSHLKEMLV